MPHFHCMQLPHCLVAFSLLVLSAIAAAAAFATPLQLSSSLSERKNGNVDVWFFIFLGNFFAFFVSHINHSGFVSRLWCHFRLQIGSIHDAFRNFSLLSLGFLCEGFLSLFFWGLQNFPCDSDSLCFFVFRRRGEYLEKENEAILPCFFEFRWRVEHLEKENGAISTWVPSICSSVWLHFLSVSAAYDADFPASELCAFWFWLFSFAKFSLVIWIRVVCVSVLVFFLFTIFEILIDLMDARCLSYSKFVSSSFFRLGKPVRWCTSVVLLRGGWSPALDCDNKHVCKIIG